MAKLCSRPLRPNPFHTYRDPHTGKWVVVESASSETQYAPQVIDSLIRLELAQAVPWPVEVIDSLIRLELAQAVPSPVVANSSRRLT